MKTRDVGVVVGIILFILALYFIGTKMFPKKKKEETK